MRGRWIAKVLKQSQTEYLQPTPCLLRDFARIAPEVRYRTLLCVSKIYMITKGRIAWLHYWSNQAILPYCAFLSSLSILCDMRREIAKIGYV